MRAVEEDRDWWTKNVTTGSRTKSTAPGSCCADCGFTWHLRRPGDAIRHDGEPLATRARIRRGLNASNPCSEYMFLDDTACNLASAESDEVQGGIGQFEAGSVPAGGGRDHHGAGNPGGQRQLPDQKRLKDNSHDFRPLGPRVREFGSAD